MQRLYLLAVLPLAGCAANPPESVTGVAGERVDSSGPAVAAVAPAETFEIEGFDQETVCEKIKGVGSRIVRETRCYTPDANSEVSEERRREEVARVHEALRREQDNLERTQRQEMERQRALMQRSLAR